jgi:transcriptional regulator with XRE-family HTH domain
MEVIKGSDLKLLLKRKGITQELLSEKTGVVRSSISRYFTDEVTMPYHFLLKVAALSGLQIKDLIKYSDQEVIIKAKEPPAEYNVIKKDYDDMTLDDLGTIIRNMQEKIAELQKQVGQLQKNHLKAV